MSNKQVAELMNNSIRTIELRRAAIYDKMDVKSTVDLARLLQSVNWAKSDSDSGSHQ
jgi:DNA-binding NarL/FixJ family response regulator